jgi:BirA family transcriptional regulator, biotin operon repressor / biotin---[acetyl-CoA-carboxylase] ligase
MSTRDSLLRAFKGREGKVVSGADIAKKLGLTRTAVWKQINALRAMGLPIKSTERNGYRFEGPADFSLLAPRFSASVQSWITPHTNFSTFSTQKLAKAAAAQGAREGELWMAEVQSAGRGRLERKWESPFGGLWFSLLLRPRVSPADVPPLAQVVSLAMAAAIESLYKVKALLKWPNDIVVMTKHGRRKIAGILTEMSGEMDRTNWVVVGIGVNVHNSIPSPLASVGSSLYMVTGQVVPRIELLDRFLTYFHKSYRVYLTDGFTSFRDSYWKRYWAPDQPVRLQTSRGLVRGTARGVDARGALLVESGRKIESLFEGEIVS